MQDKMAAVVDCSFDTETLMVPVELATKCRGLALDMGGSVLKVVYRTIDELDDAASTGSRYCRLHVLSFERNDLERGLEHIRRNAHMPATDGDQPTTLYTTGVGSHEFGKRICQQLNVRLHNLAEFDCFVKSFTYLAARMPRTQLLEPFLDEAVDEPASYVASQLAMMLECQSKNVTHGLRSEHPISKTLKQQLLMSSGRPAALDPPPELSEDIPLLDAEPEIFPCILAMCGSGKAVMKIEKNGAFKIIDVSSRGGRSFIGIGTLLTSCKTYNELIDMASKGNSRNVNVYSDELLHSRDAVECDNRNLYSMLEKSTPQLMYCFGKAATAEQNSFRREDVASAWLNYVILDLVECLHSMCNIHSVRRVFFCGGFCSSTVVRRSITAELARRNMFVAAMSHQAIGPVVFDFVKSGQHLGALGCLITDIDC